MKRRRQVRPAASDAVTALEPAAHGGGHGFPVVGIGASAGGLEALEALFEKMPHNTGMAFVIVTHQQAGHPNLLPALLRKSTLLPVIEAADGKQVEPNHIYVSPPGKYLDILDGTLRHVNVQETSPPQLPIDHFLRSLAADQKDKAMCIILSGTGTDGTLGLKAVKGESGMAMVQQAQSARYAGMPSSAMATGLADYVLPVTSMPDQLITYARGPYLSPAQTEETPTVPTEPMQKIFVQLRARTGHDFSGYKASTIRRRIERRMNLHQIKGAHQYLRFLQENPHEIDCLFKELLISVTCFFRDPPAFESLAKSALPRLLQSRPENSTVSRAVRDYRRIHGPIRGRGQKMEDLPPQGIHACLASAHRVSDRSGEAAHRAAQLGRRPPGQGSEPRSPGGSCTAQPLCAAQRGSERARRGGLYPRPHRPVS